MQIRLAEPSVSSTHAILDSVWWIETEIKGSNIWFKSSFNGLKSAQGAQFAPSFLSSRLDMVLWNLQVLFFVLHRLEAGNGAPRPTGVSARVRVRGRSSVRVSVHPFICPSACVHARVRARVRACVRARAHACVRACACARARACPPPPQ